MHELYIYSDVLKIQCISVGFFWSNTCLKFSGRDIENSSFSLADRLALWQYSMGSWDNASIYLVKSFLAAIPEGATLLLIFGFLPNSLQWRHNEQDCVSNHQPRQCLLYRLFGRKHWQNHVDYYLALNVSMLLCEDPSAATILSDVKYSISP